MVSVPRHRIKDPNSLHPPVHDCVETAVKGELLRRDFIKQAEDPDFVQLNQNEADENPEEGGGGELSEELWLLSQEEPERDFDRDLRLLPKPVRKE